MTPEARAEFVRLGMLELQAVRGRLAKVTTDDVTWLLALLDEDPAGLDGIPANVWADVQRFVRWSANVRDDTAEAIAVARDLHDRIGKAILGAHGLRFAEAQTDAYGLTPEERHVADLIANAYTRRGFAGGDVSGAADEVAKVIVDRYSPRLSTP